MCSHMLVHTLTVEIRSPLLTSENNSIGKLFETSLWLPCKYKSVCFIPKKEKEIEEKKK